MKITSQFECGLAVEGSCLRRKADDEYGIDWAHGGKSLCRNDLFSGGRWPIDSRRVEYYLVDYARRCQIFYGSDGASAEATIPFQDLPPVSADFSASDLRANILDIQTKGQKFEAFSRRAMQAGVQSYYAFLRGNRVTYIGRQGDQHTEWFPGAAPQTQNT